jgi:hypothetical protein
MAHVGGFVVGGLFELALLKEPIGVLIAAAAPKYALKR